ncbi:isoleucine--tRNA ligase [Clostridium sp. CAG:451]|nr:isoleucine--tRNA ligase [Clostridium sp. CAG:451]
MEFKELKKGDVHNIELEIAKEWENEDILKKCIDNRKDCENFVFYDGPATANGMPGLHHMMAKFLKDTFCKYKTMQGYRVLRKVGWDTHGLPVELQVEKELGFNSKKDIEEYGIEEFNKKCKESVWKNEKAFSDLTKEMGQFIDLEHPYVTYDNNYIETEWWILKKFFDEGLFYEGHKILPFCTRCGTGLASHEVAQGYKEVTANTVIVPMKKKDEDVYFLVWTTTPWTLISNVALCVNPKELYILAESRGTKFIVAKALANKVLGDDYTVLEEYSGKNLEYMEYEQLIPSLKVDKKAFFVTVADYVTMDAGTGIVHIAPAFGQDDYNVGKRYDLPVLNPVGEDGCYTEGLWKGRNVFEVDIDVIKYLKENDKLFKKEKIKHDYPHCWRCGTPLLYYAKPSYYLEVTKLKDQVVKNNNGVNWYPSFVGEKRFGNWLLNMNDWAISRNRYWGTPLPLWRCSCGHMEMIGSRKELVAKSIEEIDESIDLHRPYVDNVHITCPDCGKEMSRVKEVIDCWFDSGSMPFAQYHYPFENKELFEEQFPANFICEGIDQTRGWFYTLLLISTFVTGKAPYKNVLVNDLLLDKFGKKMSKSKGNIVEPFTTMKKYGADTIRFYLPYVSPVWSPIKFDDDGLKEVYSKYLSTFKNAYSFFEMYANADKIDPREYNIPVAKRDLTDRWLLSKLNHMVKDVTEGYEKYDLNIVVHKIVDFINDDFSNWYIRSNRRRFWASELTEDKKAVYLTTYETLLTLAKITAPVTPYISEEIYQNLTGKTSVHLEDFPKVDEELLSKDLEQRMELVRDICSLGRNAREDAAIKVRQPLNFMILPLVDEAVIEDFESIIKEELNIKEIVYKDDMTEYMDYIVKPNFKVVGKVFGPKMKDFQEAVSKLNINDVNKIKAGYFKMNFLGEEIDVTEDMILTTLKNKKGYCAASNGKTSIVLDTSLTEDLILEGLAREVVRKVQSLRKEADFVITDHINLYYHGDEMFDKMLASYDEYIKNETLADSLVEDQNIEKNMELNDIVVGLRVERI